MSAGAGIPVIPVPAGQQLGAFLQQAQLADVILPLAADLGRALHARPRSAARITLTSERLHAALKSLGLAS